MSTPEHPTTTTADALVADIDHRLKRHLRRADRRTITADLLADLRAAEADGRDPAQMIGGDVDDFVQRTVEEGGYVVVTRDTPRVALLGTLVAVPAVVVVWLLSWEVVQPVFTAVVSANLDIPHTGVAGAWVGVWAIGVAAVLVALAVCLYGRPAARTTLTAALVTVPLAATVAVATNLAVLDSPLPITPGSIVIQVAGLLLPLVCSLVVARWWGLRRAQSFPAEPALVR